MKRFSIMLGIMLMLLVSTSAFGAVDVMVFDGTFVRGTSTPVTESKTFPGINGPAIIKVVNGSLEDSATERVSSSVISVNGEVIFDESNFNQNVDVLTREIVLNEGDNSIDVLLKSKPGGTLVVQIIQDQSIIIPSSTKVLDAETVQKLVSIVEGNIFIFSDGTAQLATLKPGDVIVCGVSAMTPDGCLRQVTNVSTLNTQIVVETIQAALADAIKRAS